MAATSPCRCGPAQATTEVVVAIEDHGVGIPRRPSRGFFERFYKVDRARVRARRVGTGLGLAIARHDRRAARRPDLGRGVEGRGREPFSFAIPVVRGPAGEPGWDGLGDGRPRSPGRRARPGREAGKIGGGPWIGLHVATLNIRKPRDRMVRTAAAPAQRHVGAPARPARPAGGRLPDAAGTA
jgi:hypothetical protein